MFVRFQAPIPVKRGVHTGVFGLPNPAEARRNLTPDERAAWREGNDWHNAAYPDPTDADPSVYDETAHPLATAWSKVSATHLLDRVTPYLAILNAQGVECLWVQSEDPGRVICEDDVQIVVVPHDQTASTSFHPST